MIAWAAIAMLSGCLDVSPLTDAERQEQIARMYATYHVDFADVPGIAADDLAERLEHPDAPLLVDVRPEVERAVSTIPGTMSREAFEADRERFRDRDIVAYCTVGARSGWYASSLREEGWSVRNLEGGLLAWTHAGGALTDASGDETRRIHVYGKRWNLAAKGYEPVLTDASGAEVPCDRTR